MMVNIFFCLFLNTLTIEIKGVGMFGTRVAAATEEAKHLLWRATEHQLSIRQNGNFIEVLVGQQMVLVCASQPGLPPCVHVAVCL